MERKNHFERIIGTNEEGEKERALDFLEKLYARDAEAGERHRGMYVEKTHEHEDLFNWSQKLVNEEILKYDITSKDVPFRKLALVKEGEFEKNEISEIQGASSNPLTFNMYEEDTGVAFNFLTVTSHELLHLKSHKAARVKKDGDISLYRSGLQMADIKDTEAVFGEERIYFDDLEEAVVAECNKHIREKLLESAQFKENASATKEIILVVEEYFRAKDQLTTQNREVIEEIVYIPMASKILTEILEKAPEERGSYAIGYLSSIKELVVSNERLTERKHLYGLMEAIYEKNSEDFVSPEHVFSLIAKANFSGHYLELAHLVEKTFGKGSFRKLALETSSKKK